MHFAELGPVAFIDDEYNPVFPVAVDHLMLRFDGIGHLLNSRQNQRSCPVSHLFQQFVGIVGHVHRIRFKLIELRQSLGVQILPVNQEKDFLDAFFLGDDLASFERGQRLSAPCCMPNIPIIFCLQCLPY